MDADEFSGLLEQLSGELRTSIEELQQKLSQAESLQAQVQTFLDQSQTVIDGFIGQESHLTAIVGNAQTLDAEIVNLKNNAQDHLNTISSDLSSVHANIEEMNSAYQRFNEVNAEVSSDETGLAAALANAHGIATQVEDSKNTAQEHLDSISATLASVQANVEEMNSAYVMFSEINGDITNEETGLAAVLAQSTSLKDDIEATRATAEVIFTEINKFKDTAAWFTGEIETSDNAAKSITEQIKQNHQISIEIKEKMKNILNISALGAHANYFDKRKKQLGYMSFAWLVLFFLMLSVTFLLGREYISPLVAAIKGKGPNVTNIAIEAFLIRLGLVMPAILAALYCLEQFSNDRRLYEQYAFKSISMVSVESSVELLARAFDKTELREMLDNKIIAFAVQTFESIYREPFEPRKRSFSLKGNTKVFEAVATLEDTVGGLQKDFDRLKEERPKDLLSLPREN